MLARTFIFGRLTGNEIFQDWVLGCYMDAIAFAAEILDGKSPMEAHFNVTKCEKI